MSTNTDLSVVTGSCLTKMKIKGAMSDSMLGDLFGLSPGKVKIILESGDQPINDPVICYIYRQYSKANRLVPRKIDLKDFYEKIGGRGAYSGSDFSLIIGRELSAYVRYFSGGGATPSLNIMIQNAFDMAFYNRVNEGKPPYAINSIEEAMAAFQIIKDLCKEEGVARGFDPLETRRWGEGDITKAAD